MIAKERLLLIDTCGETAGVALSAGDQVLSAEDLVRGSASAEIVSAVRRLLLQTGWRLQDLHAVGVVTGPGSFTGIRAGLAAAKGLCEATGLPLAAVSRLAVLADAASLQDGFAALDAGRGEVYVREQPTGREWLSSTDDLAATSLGRLVVVAEARLAERLNACSPVLHPLHAADALRAVLQRLKDDGSDVAITDANYVREERDIYLRPAEGAKAPSSGVAMIAGWSVRRALRSDAEAILAIEQACIEAPHWSPAVWRGALADTAPGMPARATFVADDGKGIAGFAVVSCAGGVAELENIAVQPDARCQGFGRMLCSEAIGWSRSRMARVLELEVRASSAGALALYRSLGFVDQGRRRSYYREPIEDAVLMSVTLQG